jgi:hypothetical protein
MKIKRKSVPMPSLVLSPHDLGAVRDVAGATAAVAVHVDDDALHLLAEPPGREPAVVVTGAPLAAQLVADELARTLGARVRYVEEATACAAALGRGELLLHWSTQLSLHFAGGLADTAAASAFGHLSVDPRGAPCACGGRGCLQDEAGTAALTARFATIAGRSASVGQLMALTRAGQPTAARILGRAVAVVARQLAPVCASASIDRLVLSGPVAAAGAPIGDRFREELAQAWAGPVAVTAADAQTVLRGALRIARGR